MKQSGFHDIMCVAALLAAFCLGGCTQQQPRSVAPPAAGVAHLLENADLQSLGQKIFFDTSLSFPPGQSCAACHSPEVGWTGPGEELNKAGSVYPGAVHTRFGNRKPNSSAYAPEFRKVAKEIWHIEDVSTAKIEITYGIVGLALAAFEHSEIVNQFSSKYDHVLQGKAALTAEEKHGLELFEGKGKCAECHTSTSGPNGEPPLFTDFTYDNLGFPKNPENPWYTMPPEFNPEGNNWIDPGLADFLKEVPQYAMYAQENFGKHRVPTLRNVDLRPSPSFVKAFGHNGYFKSLESLVHFYNTRDVLPKMGAVTDRKPGVNCWPEPEVAQNLNTSELGKLGLTSAEEAAIVAFLKTLSDGYQTR